MAQRRMFTKKVTDDDNFMSLSSSAQALYLHLSMCADDDGFCNQITVSMFKAHASVQDLQALLEKRYIYQFENGVIVIKHWRMANALRKDRYTPTNFQEEFAKLDIKDNGAYTLAQNGCRVVAERLPQVSIGKDSIDKYREEEDSIGEDICVSDETPPTPAKSSKPSKHKYGEYKHVLLTDKEHENLTNDFGSELRDKAIKLLDEYIEEKGYKSKSHNLAIRRWVMDAVRERESKQYGKGNQSYQKQTKADELDQFYAMANDWADS